MGTMERYDPSPVLSDRDLLLSIPNETHRNGIRTTSHKEVSGEYNATQDQFRTHLTTTVMVYISKSRK